MTAPGAEITEAVLTWANKLISAPNVGLPLVCSFAEKPFLVTLAFWAAPRILPSMWAISSEEHHSQRAAVLLLPRAVSWEPLLGEWGTLCEGSNAVLQFLHLF